MKASQNSNSAKKSGFNRLLAKCMATALVKSSKRNDKSKVKISSTSFKKTVQLLEKDLEE